MEKRAIFPTFMFILAGCSFGFGIWQYVYAQGVQASDAKRMAFIMTSIERSDVPRAKKQDLYASITSGLPPAPHFFGIDVSGSFASQEPTDTCSSDGQRAICRALKADATDQATMQAICGSCDPK